MPPEAAAAVSVAHVLVVGVVDAEVAMRVDDARHQQAALGVDLPLPLGQRVVGADGDDAAVACGDATVELPGVRHDAGVADDEVGLHCVLLPDSRSSMRRRIPAHWLRPTVTGARRPSPRAHTPMAELCASVEVDAAGRRGEVHHERARGQPLEHLAADDRAPARVENSI